MQMENVCFEKNWTLFLHKLGSLKTCSSVSNIVRFLTKKVFDRKQHCHCWKSYKSSTAVQASVLSSYGNPVSYIKALEILFMIAFLIVIQRKTFFFASVQVFRLPSFHPEIRCNIAKNNVGKIEIRALMSIRVSNLVVSTINLLY